MNSDLVTTISTNKMMWPLLIVLIVIFTLINIYKLIVRKFLKSEKFINLNRRTDNVSEFKTEIEMMMLKLNKNFQDFNPTISETIKRVKDADHAFECPHDIYKRIVKKDLGQILNLCGFTNNNAIKIKVKEMVEDANSIENMIMSMRIMRKEAIRDMKSSVPKYILMTSKKKILVLLDLDFKIKDIYKLMPRLTFISDKTGDQYTIIFDHQMLLSINAILGDPEEINVNDTVRLKPFLKEGE